VDEDFERAVAFERLLQERTSTRIEPFRWGRALYNDDIPERYYSNFVRIEQPLEGVEVESLVQATDRALAGLRHRQIQVDDEGDGARIALGLGELGYTGDHSSFMALRRAPDRLADLDAVTEISYAEARPFEVEVYRRELSDVTEAVVEKFADFRQVVQRAVGGRFFAQRIDGRVAGQCELYLVDGYAQVEHVDTLEEFRGRGVARNVVLRAAQEASAAGADLIVINTDLTDWPMELYRRLGFDEIGSTWAFTKLPETGASTE
jgi:ribosomal protein S18 acetylase RimI-like enzyme